jgi:hypothetical protein
VVLEENPKSLVAPRAPESRSADGYRGRAGLAAVLFENPTIRCDSDFPRIPHGSPTLKIVSTTIYFQSLARPEFDALLGKARLK